MVEYLGDVTAHVNRNANALANSPEFKAIYKNSLASFVTLKAFSRNKLRLLRSAAELCRRVPVLLVSSQVSEATASLRRFVELIAWFPFFSDHPVEWHYLQREPALGYTRYEDKPIAYAAHREFGFYIAYIVEKAECGPGAPLAQAVADLQSGFRDNGLQLRRIRRGL